MGVLSVPLGPETSSTSGIGIAFSVKKKKKIAESSTLCYRIGILRIFE